MSATASTGTAVRAGAAIVAGAAILVLLVLPAELGVDPTGFGKVSGLSALSAPVELTELERGALREGAVVSFSDVPLRTDRWTFELAPYKSIEFKYTLDKGAAMLFEWQASGELHYDMHSHPFEGGTALTESYKVGDAARMKGSYVAPFAGIHGWYWQNQTPDTVTLTLEATGGFSESTIFDELGEHSRPIGQVD